MNGRVRILIRGAVQGVGFRPFIYRLAAEMDLRGWVMNSAEGVSIEAEGEKKELDIFLLRIGKEKPARSSIQSFEFSFLDPEGFKSFEIRPSDNTGGTSVTILPDIATCSDCLRDIFDPADRRYRYPFTNCTNCGPRFSIIEALPYDRANTTMKSFSMCPDCMKEYEDPGDRRFHAQPNACPVCGPRVELRDVGGKVLARDYEALTEASVKIREGKIVGVKGLGGFHLIVNALDGPAVARLRERKRREEKPFALMYPDIEMIKGDCIVLGLEERLLLSSESPIVLLRRKPEPDGRRPGIAAPVAPGNPYLGIMLPYTPLHHLLMRELNIPVVATSGNLSDEPICINERDAARRLRNVADYFLTHNRPIKRHVDDSIVRVVMGRELVLRRARGYAPLPLYVNRKCDEPVLAVGAHLKNNVALSVGDKVFVSQHIGDLETKEAYAAFIDVIGSLTSLYRVRPAYVVSDMHPAYLSTQYADKYRGKKIQIQHHFAHIASCMAENQIEGNVLGVSWDGTGFGSDGTVWGGEFLSVSGSSFKRVAAFRTFRLPGGEKAVREPRRAAIGVLYEIFGERLFMNEYLQTAWGCTDLERKAFTQMLSGNINSPLTSSVGRLFDAVSSIADLRQFTAFEGQAAMDLEFAAGDFATDESYEFRISENRGADSPLIIDWEQMILKILEEVKAGVKVGVISAKFHNTLACIIVRIAERIGEPRVVLSGGCFQNKYLTERAIVLLERGGFKPYWHQRIPPNDGGIAFGQIAAAAFENRWHQREIGL